MYYRRACCPSGATSSELSLEKSLVSFIINLKLSNGFFHHNIWQKSTKNVFLNVLSSFLTRGRHLFI
jgi:hypothetical protein